MPRGKIILILLLAAFPVLAKGQSSPPNKTPVMNIEKLTHPTVRKAIEALQAADKKAWYALFTPDAVLFDDGNKINFKSFSERALGHERFASIDKVENNGLHIYGHFHTEQWGDFTTYFKFQLTKEGMFNRLDIGQANY